LALQRVAGGARQGNSPAARGADSSSRGLQKQQFARRGSTASTNGRSASPRACGSSTQFGGVLAETAGGEAGVIGRRWSGDVGLPLPMLGPRLRGWRRPRLAARMALTSPGLASAFVPTSQTVALERARQAIQRRGRCAVAACRRSRQGRPRAGFWTGPTMSSRSVEGHKAAAPEGFNGHRQAQQLRRWEGGLGRAGAAAASAFLTRSGNTVFRRHTEDRPIEPAVHPQPRCPSSQPHPRCAPALCGPAKGLAGGCPGGFKRTARNLAWAQRGGAHFSMAPLSR